MFYESINNIVIRQASLSHAELLVSSRIISGKHVSYNKEDKKRKEEKTCSATEKLFKCSLHFRCSLINNKFYRRVLLISTNSVEMDVLVSELSHAR